MAYPVGQTLGQSPYFRQTAPEIGWLSRVCGVSRPSSPKKNELELNAGKGAGHGCSSRYFSSLRASPRLTCTRRRPSARFPAAFCLAASLIFTRLFTTTAPAVLHIRVAVPLCCTTSVLPSIVATPPCTRTVNLSALILDLANLARMTASNCPSLSFGWTVARFVVLTPAGRGCAVVAAWGTAAHAPAVISDAAIHTIGFAITHSVAAIPRSSQNSVLK